MEINWMTIAGYFLAVVVPIVVIGGFAIVFYCIDQVGYNFLEKRK